LSVLVRAGELAAAGEPFVLATVLAVERPASARVGDKAVITVDGTLHGWIGGACSEPHVVREALRAFADGEPRTLRIGPAESGCASEGTVEVLVEPQLPAPLLAIVGEAPAARTLAELARTIGWRVEHEVSPGAEAVVVATMGRGDEEALEAALAGAPGYVGLVASAKRAAVVLGRLRERGVGEELLAQVRSPAGLDLGPSTQEEIAVAVLAELVAWRHLRPASDASPLPTAEAVDPVCGMTVAVTEETLSAEHGGTTYFFCAAHCRKRFLAEPERYLTATGK
jgi:xanthine dehydrogenase accessory factor